jgi:NhaP-type Na+/H+ or K+/H+ antiporter
VILVGLVLAVAGFVVGVEGGRGRTMFIAGIVLGMLGGLETSVRDHFAGYRSHTTLLSGAVAIAAIVVITLVLRLIAPGVPVVAMFAVGAVVFAAAFPLLRRTFQRRSGGLSFR